jgi:hypothetical protein
MSTSLTGTQIETTYGDLLQLGNSGGGVTGSMLPVRDGLGTATSFVLSGTAAKFTGTLEVVGALTLDVDLTVPNGGTGAVTFTAYAVLCGGTTATGAVQSVASVGTSGQVLTSNGAGALPSFQAAAGQGNLTGPITSVGLATAVASQTGTGSTFMMQASPTTTGTLTAAAINASGTVTCSGASNPLDVEGTAATGLQIVQRIAKQNNTSPLPVIGFDVTNAAGETACMKMGIGVERWAANGAGSLYLYCANTGNGVNLVGNRASAGDIKLTIDKSGFVGINTSAPATCFLDVNVQGGADSGTTTCRLHSGYAKGSIGTQNVLEVTPRDTTDVLGAIDYLGRWLVNPGLFTSFGPASADVSVQIGSRGAAMIAATIRGATSQTSDLLQWQKQDATVLASVGPTGYPKWPGSNYLTADVTNATATMANIKTLANCISGVTYSGIIAVPASDSTALDGLAFDFNGGTATFSGVDFGFIGVPLGATLGTAYSTALGTSITVTTATTADVMYLMTFSGVCNGSGTLILRGAQVAHTTGTATFRAGTFGKIDASF